MDEQPIFSPSYPVELLCREPVRFDREALRTALARRLGEVDCARAEAPGKPLLCFLRDHPVETKDGTVPAQLAFLLTERPVDPRRYEAALAQSWDIDEPGERLEGCRASFAMFNLISSRLPQLQRRQIVAGGLLALLDQADAELVYWPQTQQLLDPGKVRAKLAEPDELANPFYGFVNVRLFNVEESGERVMDTLGLGALGLTDLQMHFRELQPGRVAALLYGLAAYILEHGDVIDNGDTVQGLSATDHWQCLHEIALAAPERVVLDVRPDPPYAGGDYG